MKKDKRFEMRIPEMVLEYLDRRAEDEMVSKAGYVLGLIREDMEGARELNRSPLTRDQPEKKELPRVEKKVSQDPNKCRNCGAMKKGKNCQLCGQ